MEFTEFKHFPIIKPLKVFITPNTINDITPKRNSNLNIHKSFKIVLKVNLISSGYFYNSFP